MCCRWEGGGTGGCLVVFFCFVVSHIYALGVSRRPLQISPMSFVSFFLSDDSAAAAASSGSEGVLLEQLMDLLDRPLYTMSGPDLDELLQLIEVLVAPLANLNEVIFPRACVCLCGNSYWLIFTIQTWEYS